MIIQSANAVIRGKDEMSIKNYITKDISGSFSLAVVTLKGDHPRTSNVMSDRAYFVISGEGVVHVGDETGAVKAGDAVYIPKGIIHSISGNVVYVVINSPAYDPANEVKP